MVTGMLIANAEPHQKCSISQPPSTRPSAPPPPAMPAQMAMALARSLDGKLLTRMLSVAGMTSAPPMPMTARAAMTSAAESAKKVAYAEPSAEQHDARLHEALAAEAVAQRAGGEQHAGEHERVGVDDPLLLAVGQAERLRHRRQGDVQRGVADDDDDQAHAQHAEDHPPPTVDVGRDLVAIVESSSNGVSSLIAVALTASSDSSLRGVVPLNWQYCQKSTVTKCTSDTTSVGTVTGMPTATMHDVRGESCRQQVSD